MTKNKHIILETTEEEHRQTIETMEQFLDIQDNPKVGPFFYEPNGSVLFGVLALLSEGLAKNRDGLVTSHTFIEKFGKKGVRKQQQKYNDEGPFKGEYEATLRG